MKKYVSSFNCPKTTLQRYALFLKIQEKNRNKIYEIQVRNVKF